jgi:hypothetical protein
VRNSFDIKHLLVSTIDLKLFNICISQNRFAVFDCYIFYREIIIKYTSGWTRALAPIKSLISSDFILNIFDLYGFDNLIWIF